MAINLLSAAVSTEEIWAATKSLGCNKSPGLDGITSSFFKAFWEVVSPEVCNAILEFFSTGHMPTDWKDTLVVLIPKVVGAATPAKFRPISLCQTIYKIVAKILVARLKGLLPPLISMEQGAFVPNRSISHHCLLAQEIINKFRTSTAKSGLMALKIDMEQAYDRMSWNTLRRVLEEFRFPPIFINWIMQCVTAPRFSLLINGTRTEWINAQCGFRQGCPLSPYLFIICSELLSLALNKSGENIGISLCQLAPRISHLLYADDILIFSEASMIKAKRIASILNEYCSWTGQKVHPDKSAIIFSKATVGWKGYRIARFLGYRRTHELDYLGVKLVMRRLQFQDFSKLLQKCQTTTRAWGNRHLSMAGRVTLINSSLFTMPMFAMTHMKLPKGVLMEVEKIGRSFLWDKGPNSKGIHYIKWEKLCRPMKFGGLGFHASSDWCGPLRARLMWDALHRRDCLFSQIMLGKYGERIWDSDYCRTDSTALQILRDGAANLRGLIRWNVNSGKNIHIVNHAWILDQCIARWPTFFNLDAVPGDTVADLLKPDRTWDSTRLCDLFGDVLTERICNIPIGHDGADEAELIHKVSGMTITGLAFLKNLGELETADGWFRHLHLHPRERMFWWRVCMDAIPTRHWLHRHRLTEESSCPRGCSETEDMQHITTSCGKLCNILSILGCWGFSLPRFTSMQGLRNWCTSGKKEDMANIRVYCTAVYHNWRNRNDEIHNRSPRTPTSTAAAILSSLSSIEKFTFLDHWSTNQPVGLSCSAFWCPPPPRWLKINVDGSLLLSRCAGIGMVVRNEHGNILAAFGHSFEHWDSGQVELLAIMGIKQMIQPFMFDADGIIIEGDNINVINFIQAQLCRKNWELKIHVDMDTSFLFDFKRLIFTHVTRNKNRVANFCASYALQHRFTWQFFDPDLEDLSFLAREDLDHL